ncbi:MAG: TonB-dependent receptor, partial [Flavobacteriales bacterium]|nr:TonB-dependent receptor [Flavobacteriales bacterium]
IVTNTLLSQNTVEFTVNGACGMCKTRIENTTSNFENVKGASWDKDSQKLSIIFKENTKNLDIKVNEIKKAIAKSGHDTDRYKATKEDYYNLPMCCQYREDEDEDQGDYEILNKNGHERHGHSHEVYGSLWHVNLEGKKVPLVGANIYWKESKNGGTTSNKSGSFIIHNHDNYHTLVISYIGYPDKEINIGTKDMLEATLTGNNLLDEIIITTRKKSTITSFLKAQKIQVISENELHKTACCNISESFETNPSVDVSSTDAVTGTRQIEMLGLSGSYVQITRENMPDTRGLSSIYGLTYTPGTWVESIQLNTGTGSVVNGYESITGQINVELKKPENSEKVYLNAYANAMGRLEGNANFSFKINENVSTSLLLHANTRQIEWDKNNDGFLDILTGDQLIAMNRWKIKYGNGWEGQIGLKATYVDNQGGEINSTESSWKSKLKTNRYEAWTKLGKVINDKSSFGVQLSASTHQQESNFGNRIYDASQNSFYLNTIYQYALNSRNEIKTGVSFMYDDFDETIDADNYLREEKVVGAFAEYTYKPSEKISAIIGLRIDNHNIFGTFVTPRFHLRYAPLEKTVFRASAGRGQKTSSIFAENIGAFASNRTFVISMENDKNPYGLNPEVAWSYGFSFSQGFIVNSRDVILNIDYFYTDFENQVVVDYDINPQELHFYNLDGRSFSNSLQFQLDWEFIERFDLRVAYRYNDVKSNYNNKLQNKPLVAKHRAFANFAYETLNKWKFDLTVNWQGKKRLPDTSSNPDQYKTLEYSPDYWTTNMQVSKGWEIPNLEIYLGVENLFDYKQDKPIISAENPQSKYFDASMIWGPVFGRNIYAGLRYKI